MSLDVVGWWARSPSHFDHNRLISREDKGAQNNAAPTEAPTGRWQSADIVGSHLVAITSPKIWISSQQAVNGSDAYESPVRIDALWSLVHHRR